MTLKIEKVSDGRKRIIRLNSRLRSEHLDELKTLIKGDQSRIALDLDGVTLVDVEVVRFLNACEEKGHEPPYRVFRRYGADARRRWGNCPHRQPSQLKKGYVTMMTRRMFSTSILAGVAAALLPAAARSQTSVKARNVVLVHGAYADGSSWLEVIPYLQAAGMKATAVQNPLSSLADDVAATKRILALQDGPTVLVGHSWAGND